MLKARKPDRDQSDRLTGAGEKGAGRYFRPDQVAVILNVGVRTVFRLIEAGDLAAVTRQGGLRVSEEALRGYLQGIFQVFGDDDRLIARTDAAARLGREVYYKTSISVQTVKRLERAGLITAGRVGGQVRITESSIDQLVEDRIFGFFPVAGEKTVSKRVKSA